jgi:decaprenylphospho-beta-D-erythro-pentofuranosid-2-ulose 2-reductase
VKDAVGSVQSVLVLGGGSDLGLAIAHELVGRRARTVVLAGRDPQRFAAGAAGLRDAGAARVETMAFDATDFASHAGFVDDVFALVGDIDLVVVAFGVLGDAGTAEHDVAAALEIVQTNYTGVVSISVPLAQRLEAQGHGTIVLLSSVAGERVRKANFVYGSSKAGADGFFQGLGDRLAGTGVHVMIVRPGFVRTKMTAGMKDAPLAATPANVATAVADALARDREIIWVPAPLRWVMAALRHVPRPIFRRLPF